MSENNISIPVNKYIVFFSTCLVQLINLESHDLTINTIPVILSNFVSKVISNTTIVSDNTTSNSINEKYSWNLAVQNKNWHCTAQLFLYPPSSNDSLVIGYNHESYKRILEISHYFINFGRRKNYFHDKSIHYFQDKPHQIFSVLLFRSVQNVENYLMNSPLLKVYRALLYEMLSHNFQFYPNLFAVNTDGNKQWYYFCKYCSRCQIFTPILIHKSFTYSWDKLQTYLAQIKSAKQVYTTNWKHIVKPDINELNIRMTFDRKLIDRDDKRYAIGYLNQALASLIVGNCSRIADSKLIKLAFSSCNSERDVVKLLPSIRYMEGPKMQFLVLQEFHPVRFLACGGHRYSHITTPLSFILLYKVFDKTTWKFILLANIIVIIFIKLIDGISLYNVILNSFAILLEQEQNRVSKLGSKKGAHFFCYSSLILVGLLLSSAYKGENINKLTAPVKPPPYETFEELAADNLTLYNIDLKRILEITSPPLLTKKREMELLNRTKERPNLGIYNNIVVVLAMRKCWKNNGAAIFMKEQWVYRFAQELSKQFSFPSEILSISKEVYAGGWYGLTLVNNEDLKVVQRTKVLGEAGIITQWIKMRFWRMLMQKCDGCEHWAENTQAALKMIVEKTKKRGRKGTILESNLLVIFVVLGGAIGLAALSFGIELIVHRQVWLRVVK